MSTRAERAANNRELRQRLREHRIRQREERRAYEPDWPARRRALFSYLAGWALWLAIAIALVAVLAAANTYGIVALIVAGALGIWFYDGIRNRR